jgi:Domain of unknown function (DUF4395)
MPSIRDQLLAGEPFWLFPRRVSAAATRLVAGLVVVGIVTAWWLQLPWLLAAVAGDFGLRMLGGPKFSPVARLALLLAIALRLPMTTVAGPPKQIAAMVGLTMLGTASGLLFGGMTLAGWIIAGMVALFATLEATIGFCVACRIYDVFIPCPDCVRGSGDGI